MTENGAMRAPISCAGFERWASLYACDELETAERAAVETHAAACAACAATLAAELRLHRTLAAAEQPADRIDPSGLLLAQCRSELDEALDETGARRQGRSRLAVLWPKRWMALHPAWSAALLVLLGVAAGRLAPELYDAMKAQPLVPSVTVSADGHVSEQELQNAGVSGINWAPGSGAGAPRVEVRLTAEKPIVLEGAPGDTDVQRVLTYVIENGQRFDPGVRLDSVDVLRTQTGDADVRRALCAAVRKDKNPAVRMRALEALRGTTSDNRVRQTLLDALLNDSNPGVRIEAINALRALAEAGAVQEDSRVLQVLRDRMQRDPNHYIRLQSAAAIRRIDPSALY